MYDDNIIAHGQHYISPSSFGKIKGNIDNISGLNFSHKEGNDNIIRPNFT